MSRSQYWEVTLSYHIDQDLAVMSHGLWLNRDYFGTDEQVPVQSTECNELRVMCNKAESREVFFVTIITKSIGRSRMDSTNSILIISGKHNHEVHFVPAEIRTRYHG